VADPNPPSDCYSSVLATAPIALQVGSIYRRTLPGHGNKKEVRTELWRLLCIDNSHDELIFKSVAVRWDKVEKMAFLVPRTDALSLQASGLLVEVDDGVRPHFMSWDDEQLIAESPKAAALKRKHKSNLRARLQGLESWLAARDKDFDVIKSLVVLPSGDGDGQEGLRSAGEVLSREEAHQELLVRAYSPRHAARSVRECATASGVTQLVVRRLLHRYAWFGMGKNALLSLDAQKGVTGILSRNTTRKSGPKDAAQKVVGEDYAVRHREERDLPKFLYALIHYWADQHISLKAAYRMMVRTLYVSRNQHGPHRIRATHIPTLRAFRYAAKALRAEHQLDRRRAGDKDGMDLSKVKGYDTDISPHVATVYDLDGSPFNRQLVGRWKVLNKRLNIGKPYVVLVFDRASKKCVGWHVYIGNENWKEGYRLAFLCAITSKAERLNWLRIYAPDAWPAGYDIRPAAIYVDGGPGASKNGRSAMKLLDVDFFISPPDTPYWKPAVEGGLGHLQAAQAHLDGGYARTKAAVEVDAKRLAKLHANTTLWEFERALVLDIIDYNARVQEKARLTDRMKQDGVMRTANAIFKWGVNKMGGVNHRRILPAEAYEKLLEHETVTLTADGVRLLNARFQSQRMDKHFVQFGRCKIVVFYDPNRPSVIYWRSPDGALDLVERDPKSNRENGLAYAHDMRLHHVHQLAKEQKDKRPRGRGTNKLTRKQEDFIEQVSNARRKPVRKSATKNEAELRNIEAAEDLRTRGYDRAENYLPVGADAGGVGSSAPASNTPGPVRTSQARLSAQRPAPSVSGPRSKPVEASPPPSTTVPSNVVPLMASRSSDFFDELLREEAENKQR